MGSAASINSLRDHSQEEVVDRCAVLYANDPMFFELVVAEAKKKALADGNKSQEDEKPIVTPQDEAKAIEEAQNNIEHKEEVVAQADGSVGAGNSIDLLSVINRVRMQPSGFILELEKHLEKFVDETVFQLKMEGKTINIRTMEGKAAVTDAIEFLKTCPPVDPLKFSPLLEKAALDHVRDISKNNVSGHEVAPPLSLSFQLLTQ